jgi:hypothetical protein
VHDGSSKRFGSLGPFVFFCVLFLLHSAVVPLPPTAAPTPPPPSHAPTAPPATSSRLSQRATEILDFFVLGAEKTKDAALHTVNGTVVEEEELLDRKKREESVRNWSKEQQTQLEDGLKTRAGRELNPQDWDEVAATVVGKTGVECCDRYRFVMAALQKKRPPMPTQATTPPPPLPSVQRSSGLTGLLSSLFGASGVFAEPLEHASLSVQAGAVFSSRAPVLIAADAPFGDVISALSAGSPVLFAPPQLREVSVQAALGVILNHAVYSPLIASVALQDDSKQTIVVLPANATARDVLQKFAIENVLHVHIQSVGDLSRIARSISREEALKYVRGIVDKVHLPRVATKVSLLAEELLISALRILSLTTEPLQVGERVLSWELIEHAGLKLVLSCLKQPVGVFLSKTDSLTSIDVPMRAILKPFLVK